MTRRLLVFLLVVLVAWMALAPAVLAEDAAGKAPPAGAASAPPAGGAAAAPPGGAAPANWSGPGFYYNLFKILGAWLVFLLWCGAADWISRDCVELKFEHIKWNPLVVGSFLLAFILLWFIPIFWVGLALIVLAYAGPLTAYVVYRNQRVQENQRVLTPAHIRYWLASKVSSVGVKMEAEKRDPHAIGVPIVLNAHGAPSERDNAARLLAARQSPGMLPARKLLADCLYRRADAVMLDYTQQGAAIRFFIDGVWQNGEPLDRETGDPMLECLKILSGLNAMDRQSRQEGKFAIDYHVFKPIVFQVVERSKEEFRKRASIDVTRELAGAEISPAELQQRVKIAVEERVREKFATPLGPWTPVEKSDLPKLKGAERVSPDNCLDTLKCVGTVASQGTPGGERVVIQLEIQKTRITNLDEVGMRPKMQEQLKELMHKEHGLLVFSAPQGGGLRTTMNVSLRSADRFMREFAAVEAEHLRYEPVENVPVYAYNMALGQTLAATLPTVFHKEPNVLVCRDLVDAESTRMLLEQATEHRMIVSTMRAKDSIEAICRVLALGVQPSELAPALTAVFSQRLVRKLCENCKEPYAPPPQVLAQLGLPPGRVQAFYRPPQQREEVCMECGGAGYRGRTAVIEMLVVDDNFRNLLASGAPPEVLLDAARKSGYRTLQEEGIVLVVKGTTSLPELIRVIKQ